jgi:hypothetical protein
VALSINNIVPELGLFLSVLNQVVLSQFEKISASTQELIWHFTFIFPFKTS